MTISPISPISNFIFSSILSSISVTLTLTSFIPVAEAALLGSWSADGTANDSIANNNGSLINGAGFDSGQFNQSFRLDGNNDFVAIANSNFWAFGDNPFSISLWANFDFIKT